jgi:hypothetical protein
VKRILHLTLHRKWFDAIATGRKKHEFRRMTAYWQRRFLNEDLSTREYDEVHFRNGYNPTVPFMRVQWKGLEIRSLTGEHLFATRLGDVLEITNWDGPLRERKRRTTNA